ncbi:ATP-binding protein [Catenovulum sediminis]|uniref:ATP-binding protein n=1 Tax=Catenovulum sediminis TaxID=1740262 RepID=A0ABV1RLE2_9ALTE|nr:ATP-binding protein [Catenovulum sediminis]
MNQHIHPILRDDYAIFTVETENFLHQLSIWVNNMVPGAYVYGIPRVGKSRAMKYWLVNHFNNSTGQKVKVFRLIKKNSAALSENGFLDEIIVALKGQYVKISNTNSKAKRYDLVYNHMATELRNLKSVQALFVIDEAQNLKDNEFKWLTNIQNMLDDFGCRLTYVLVGTEELNALKTMYCSANETHIIGRFLLYDYRFSGVRTLEELEYIFTNYDEYSEWPINSKISYTEHFFTAAFKRGFRLKDYAELFWQEYQDIYAQINTVKKLEVSMEHIGKAINYLFRTYQAQNAESVVFNSKQVKEAIQHTQFYSYMSTMFR